LTRFSAARDVAIITPRASACACGLGGWQRQGSRRSATGVPGWLADQWSADASGRKRSVPEADCKGVVRREPAYEARCRPSSRRSKRGIQHASLDTRAAGGPSLYGAPTRSRWKQAERPRHVRTQLATPRDAAQPLPTFCRLRECFWRQREAVRRAHLVRTYSDASKPWRADADERTRRSPSNRSQTREKSRCTRWILLALLN
jgi:hypothetical protein